MTPCILWTKATNKDGYGVEWDPVSRTMRLAHRMVMARIHGEDAIAGKAVMHTCDIPPCINPDHLVIGTWADNNEDMRIKGRAARGEQRPHKLTERNVREMREQYATGEWTITALAEEFGVSHEAARKVIHRLTWKHV